MKLYVIISAYNAYGDFWLWNHAYVFSDKDKALEFLDHIKKDNKDSDFELVETKLIT